MRLIADRKTSMTKMMLNVVERRVAMKKLFYIVSVVLLLFTLTGCTNNDAKVERVDGLPTALAVIENRDNLYYDVNTKIVYFIFKTHSGYSGYGYMSPYYASNGLPYRYDVEKQELVETGNAKDFYS